MSRLCKPGVALRDWVNRAYATRDKTSDGWIGDTAHAARPSDHNPDGRGIVHAIDIDGDPNTFEWDDAAFPNGTCNLVDDQLVVVPDETDL